MMTAAKRTEKAAERMQMAVNGFKEGLFTMIQSLIDSQQALSTQMTVQAYSFGELTKASNTTLPSIPSMNRNKRHIEKKREQTEESERQKLDTVDKPIEKNITWFPVNLLVLSMAWMSLIGNGLLPRTGLEETREKRTTRERKGKDQKARRTKKS